MSAATIDRVLKPYRQAGSRRSFSSTKPGTLLKAAIPIRTFTEWNENRPGFLEIDLVAHCGESSEGLYLNTLSAVDIKAGWVECRGVLGKNQQRVGGAIHHIGQNLPFPLSGNRLGQRQQVHQPSTLRLLPAEGDHLHPLQALQEERRSPR